MRRELRPPPGLRFTCSRCGDCCRSWNIMVSPEERKAIWALDWTGREERLVGRAPTVETRTGPGRPPVHRLVREVDGACLFLGSDNACLVQRHFGSEAKPTMCRIYPFGFYPMGDAVAVDSAFDCRALSLDQGRPATEELGAWRGLLAGATGEVRDRPHEVAPGRSVSGEVVWELERHLVALLGRRELPFFDRIRCALRFVALATTGDPSTPSAAGLRRAIEAGLPKQAPTWPRGGGMDKTQRVIFYQWLFLVLNPGAPNADLGSRRVEERRRIERGTRFRDRTGNPFVADRELPLTFEEVEEIDASLFEAREIEPVERFFVTRLYGQRFLVDGEGELPFTVAVSLLFLVYPMCIWTSRALAGAAGRSRVEPGDVVEALRILDRTVGRISPTGLPRKVAKAFTWVVVETGLVVAATNELLGRPDDDQAVVLALPGV